MPTYDYRCTECKHTFETVQKITDEPLLKCPICEKDTLVKVIGASSFQLKGKGWYETDYKDKK